ncbi:Ail/Lom family outer membrane beta-barrel protein [Proteus mirabilis]|uniref:Ail/Lom family outer membrane beta-barrel protein n=1 Tax=Proteus mirabilis TaxID=584 RepID=A0ABD5LRV2_PROMI|nr:Ail/Lom family outer membrane beta-barrel protein [Proteus mirabilis]
MLSTSILVVSTLSFNAYATLENTVSIGYAKSKLKVDEDLINDNLKGINLKYNHEVANDWGVISSFSYAKIKMMVMIIGDMQVLQRLATIR